MNFGFFERIVYGNGVVNVLSETYAFSKCSNLEAKNVKNFRKGIKGRTIISDKQISKTKLFRWVLCI